ncbi:MAG TPA: response regulator [Terriglobales bacterium]|nr:response regulator [Terriglobales bacterium]
MARKPKILCVDDQVENLRVRAMLLEQFGCEVVQVQDHHSTLQQVEEDDIDLIVIDYHLADGESGEEIARDVRVMRPKLPLVMLTGDSKLPDSATECVDAVLIKGASNPRALLELIERLVPGTQLKPRHETIINPQPKAS